MKKTIGKLASLMLALIMVIGVLANPAFAVNEKTFDDVAEGKWYYGYVMMLKEDEIVGGYKGTNNFEPLEKVSRREAAKMVALAADFEHEGKTATFDDVAANDWATGVIAALAEKNVVKGFRDTNLFKPGDNIQRGHAAKMVSLAFGLKEDSLDRPLNDLPANDAVVKEAIEILASNGIVKGYNDSGNFKPTEDISRAEFSKIVCIAMVASAIQEAEAEGATSEQIAKAQALLERLSVAGKDDDIDALNYLQGRVEDIEEAADAVKDVNEAENVFRLGLALDNPLFKDVDADNMEEYFDDFESLRPFKTVAEINAAIAKVNSEIANAAKYDGVDGIKERLEKANQNQVKVFEILEEEFEDADVDYIKEYMDGIFDVDGNAPGTFEAVQEAIDTVNAEKAAAYFDGLIASLPAATDLNYDNFKTYKPKFEDARAVYTKLTDKAKGHVNNLPELEAREARIAELEADLEAVREVEDLFMNLPAAEDVTRADREEIYAARDAYFNLTTDQRKLVSAEASSRYTKADAALKALDTEVETATEAVDHVEFNISTKNWVSADTWYTHAEGLVKALDEAKVGDVKAGLQARLDVAKAKIENGLLQIEHVSSISYGNTLETVDGREERGLGVYAWIQFKDWTINDLESLEFTIYKDDEVVSTAVLKDTSKHTGKTISGTIYTGTTESSSWTFDKLDLNPKGTIVFDTVVFTVVKGGVTYTFTS